MGNAGWNSRTYVHWLPRSSARSPCDRASARVHADDNARIARKQPRRTDHRASAPCGDRTSSNKKPRRSAVPRELRVIVGISNGGGGGNRTPVRRRSAPGATCLVQRSVSSRGSTLDEAHRGTSLLYLAGRRQAAATSDPAMMTLHPRARAQVGSGLKP